MFVAAVQRRAALLLATRGGGGIGVAGGGAAALRSTSAWSRSPSSSADGAPSSPQHQQQQHQQQHQQHQQHAHRGQPQRTWRRGGGGGGWGGRRRAPPPLPAMSEQVRASTERQARVSARHMLAPKQDELMHKLLARAERLDDVFGNSVNAIPFDERVRIFCDALGLKITDNEYGRVVALLQSMRPLADPTYGGELEPNDDFESAVADLLDVVSERREDLFGLSDAELGALASPPDSTPHNAIWARYHGLSRFDEALSAACSDVYNRDTTEQHGSGGGAAGGAGGGAPASLRFGSCEDAFETLLSPLDWPVVRQRGTVGDDADARADGANAASSDTLCHWSDAGAFGEQHTVHVQLGVPADGSAFGDAYTLFFASASLKRRMLRVVALAPDHDDVVPLAAFTTLNGEWTTALKRVRYWRGDGNDGLRTLRDAEQRYPHIARWSVLAHQ